MQNFESLFLFSSQITGTVQSDIQPQERNHNGFFSVHIANETLKHHLFTLYI